MAEPDPPLIPTEQYAICTVLDYLSDLFTASKYDSFSREQVLIILNLVKTDPDLIEADVLDAYQETTREIG